MPTQVKGAVILARRAFVREEFGEDSWKMILETLPDARFGRRGMHLWREEEISITDAVLSAFNGPRVCGVTKLSAVDWTQPTAPPIDCGKLGAPHRTNDRRPPPTADR